ALGSGNIGRRKRARQRDGGSGLVECRRFGRGPVHARDHEGADAQPDLGLRFHEKRLSGLPCNGAHHRVWKLDRSSRLWRIWKNSNALRKSMQIVIGNVLSAEEVALVRETLARATFEDGRETAGFAAQLVKNNRQAANDRKIETMRKLLEERILGNELFALAVRPKALTSMMFSRYEGGMQYGSHVDDALMQGMRTDVSFTLFLSDPASYDGGELVIETSAGEQPFKLPAGSMIVYPSTTLHRVAPVERGTRVAAVGWARSFVRNAEQREILFDLETARRDLFEREGKSGAFDLLSKCGTNLLRLWADD